VKIGIRGMGLIGGSFEKAFLAAGHEVINLKGATSSLIGECGLIVVCLPPLMVAAWIKENAGSFAAGTLITDAAGVKVKVCQELAELAKSASWHYVGGHPMAGKEVSGYANSEAELFSGASMIFTPYAWTEPETVERFKKIFGEIGFARFVVTDAHRHDEMIAYTSQLAHIVSSAYVRDKLSEDHPGFSAGSFQDMTRVATVDPDLWTDLFIANREALDDVLSRLIGRLSEYRDAVNSSDAVGLRQLLLEGRQAKERSR
jgi:prephenate dehydrogenase